MGVADRQQREPLFGGAIQQSFKLERIEGVGGAGVPGEALGVERVQPVGEVVEALKALAAGIIRATEDDAAALAGPAGAGLLEERRDGVGVKLERPRGATMSA